MSDPAQLLGTLICPRGRPRGRHGTETHTKNPTYCSQPCLDWTPSQSRDAAQPGAEEIGPRYPKVALPSAEIVGWPRLTCTGGLHDRKRAAEQAAMAAVEQRDRYKAMFMLANDRPDVDWRGLPVNPEP